MAQSKYPQTGIIGIVLWGVKLAPASSKPRKIRRATCHYIGPVTLSLFNELKRRNVFRVGIAYIFAAWVILQVADLVLENIGAPTWVMQTLMLAVGLGFVVALIIGWAYELTPEGVKRERDVVRDDSVTHHTAKKLDIITIGLVVVATGLLVTDRLLLRKIDNASSGQTLVIPAEVPVNPAVEIRDNHSIAVLPFAHRSAEADDLFFTDGIHDDLLTQLAKIQDVKVISRTSVMQYRDTAKSISQIAQELGVAKILEGGVQRAGKRIRINAQLIDVATDEHLWAETFDREMTVANLFEIQSEITRHIVSAVKGELTPEDQARLVRAPTRNLEAYEAFLRARSILRESSNEISRYPEAESHVLEALELDPDFGQALLLSAKLHGYVAWFFSEQRVDRRALANDALDRAGELLGADQPEWLSARGSFLYRFEQDYAGALKVQVKARAAMPGDADILTDLALIQRRLGLYEEAISSALEAARLDPASVGHMLTAIGTLQHLRDWPRFEALVDDGYARFPRNPEMSAYHAIVPYVTRGDLVESRRRFSRVTPHMSGAYVGSAHVLPLLERDFEEVIRVVESPEMTGFVEAFGIPHWATLKKAYALRGLGDNTAANALLHEITEVESSNARRFVRAINVGLHAEALALLGENQQAIAQAEEAVRTFNISMDKYEGPNILARQAIVLALTGERQRALELLHMLLNEVPSNQNRWELYLDPRWDFMRDDERFNELIRPDNLDESIHASRNGD